MINHYLGSKTLTSWLGYSWSPIFQITVGFGSPVAVHFSSFCSPSTAMLSDMRTISGGTAEERDICSHTRDLKEEVWFFPFAALDNFSSVTWCNIFVLEELFLKRLLTFWIMVLDKDFQTLFFNDVETTFYILKWCEWYPICKTDFTWKIGPSIVWKYFGNIAEKGWKIQFP